MKAQNSKDQPFPLPLRPTGWEADGELMGICLTNGRQLSPMLIICLLLSAVTLSAAPPSYFRGFTLIALKENREGDKEDDHAGTFQVRPLGLGRSQVKGGRAEEPERCKCLRQLSVQVPWPWARWACPLESPIMEAASASTLRGWPPGRALLRAIRALGSRQSSSVRARGIPARPRCLSCAAIS